MANRRMLFASISVSEQVASLGSDFARLLFTWMIAHADDYGVLPGSPAKVRALVMPMSDHTTAEVETALAEMEAAGLIWRYATPDERNIPLCQFRTWDGHQDLHKRTAARKLPTFADVSGNPPELPETSRPARAGGTEQNLTELKRRERERTRAGAHPRVDASPSEATGTILSLSEMATPAEAEPEPEAEQAAAPRQPLYAALVAAMHCEPGTEVERIAWLNACDALLAVGATPEELARRAAAYIARYERVRLTPKALVKHWGTFAPETERAIPHAILPAHRSDAESTARAQRAAQFNAEFAAHTARTRPVTGVASALPGLSG